ncbi:MAG: NAD(P)-dependent oxidoreductase [Gemmatimonadales bacterium]
MLPPPKQKDIDRKARLALPETVIPKQNPQERRGNFDEVYLMFGEETAKAAAVRCIQCPGAMCVKACPLHNDIPLALWQMEHGAFEDAARVFHLTSTMPEVCGRVCPQVILCEGACIYKKKRKAPVPIGRLEAFVADYLKSHGGLPTETEPPTGHRAAVVGAGPAGLTAAEILAKKGHAVTVFDAWPAAGGIMRYGIPTFKMSHSISDDIVAYLERLGVEFLFDTTVGKGVTVDELIEQGYEAVFLGVGAGIPVKLTAPGVDLDGIYNATPFLVRGNVAPEQRPENLRDPPEIGDRVAVIGGGDTAMDCARTAVRLGAKEVTCVYRRTEAEMPGNERDRTLAREEGVEFKWLTQPVRFIGDDKGHVRSMECIEMDLGEPDESGRRRPVPIAGSEFTTDVDTVVLALGYWPDTLVGETTPGLETHDWGLITIEEETGVTSRENVYAGGDDVLGPKLVVTAVAQAKIAAQAMHAYLMRQEREPAGAQRDW